MEKITSRRNPLCVHLKKLGASRSYRESCGEFLCDGIKLLEEAVKHGAEITHVLTSSFVPFPLPVETRVHFTDKSVINSLSPLTNAQDTLFVCKIPQSGKHVTQSETRDETKDETKDETRGGCDKGTHILLDGIQDPGNVGTIIRTANAFCIDSVILTGGCADPFNPKTIRATMGSIFRQRLCHMTVRELAAHKERGVRLIGATLEENSKDVSRVKLKGSVIAIGNEGRGLSAEVLSLCDEKIRIPISPDCESLNAATAAAIIIWRARG